MEIANKYRFFTYISICMFLLTSHFVKAQGYNGIIPLQSKCEDVKRALKVKECSFPVSEYRFERFRISIWFTKNTPDKKDRICWNVPTGTVTSIRVSYNTPIPLSKFEPSLKRVKGPIDDIFTDLYENKEKSLEAYVNNEFVNHVVYLPSELDRKTLSYACNSLDEGDKIELPSTWLERYWNIPKKKEEEILNYTIVSLNNNPICNQIYIVYFYKSETDKMEGLKQAERAKIYLENQGISSDKIKIINGGKGEKSEIVLYSN